MRELEEQFRDELVVVGVHSGKFIAERETDRIADAARVMLDIATQNDAMAREFNATLMNLVRSGQEFESEVTRFRYSASE